MNILGHNYLGGHKFKLTEIITKNSYYSYGMKTIVDEEVVTKKYICNNCKYEVKKEDIIDVIVSENMISCDEKIIKDIIE